jgi:hypothetical protein
MKDVSVQYNRDWLRSRRRRCLFLFFPVFPEPRELS